MIKDRGGSCSGSWTIFLFSDWGCSGAGKTD